MASEREPLTDPDDIGRIFVERANAGDVDGLVDLYEPDAVLAFPPGRVARGHDAIRQVYEQMLAERPTLTPGEPRPALRFGDLALTSTRLNGDATVEVVRRQPDGTWRILIDQPSALS